MQSNDSTLEIIKGKLSGLNRQAWEPIVQEGKGGLETSKISGKVWFNQGESWPICPNCQQPMRLVLQLNLQELPKSLEGKFGSGLLQLFCCESDFEIKTGVYSLREIYQFCTTLIHVVYVDKETGETSSKLLQFDEIEPDTYVLREDTSSFSFDDSDEVNLEIEEFIGRDLAYINQAGEVTFQAGDLTKEEQDLIRDRDFTQLIQIKPEQVLTEETDICSMQACHPFTNAQVVRIIQLDKELVDVEVPSMEKFFPAKLIVGWEESQEYPNDEEIERYGITLDAHEIEALGESGLSAKVGDKLAGWPCWAQSVEYPNCPVCSQEMKQFIFQLESNQNMNFPYPHHGLGVGYLVQCQDHKEQVTFFCQFT